VKIVATRPAVGGAHALAASPASFGDLKSSQRLYAHPNRRRSHTSVQLGLHVGVGQVDPGEAEAGEPHVVVGVAPRAERTPLPSRSTLCDEGWRGQG
jgi:hypothetical protein